MPIADPRTVFILKGKGAARRILSADPFDLRAGNKHEVSPFIDEGSVLLIKIAKRSLLLRSKPSLLSNLFPAPEYLAVVWSPRMAIHRIEVAHQRDRAIPCRSSARNIFQHIRLRSDRILVRSPVTDPAKIDAGKVPRRTRNLRRGIGTGCGFDDFRFEHVEGVSARQNVPAEVGFARTFSEESLGLQTLADDPLRP